jgi:hypothetical protein
VATVKLSEEARKAAHARARKAGPLPPALRRELVRLYQQQSGLTARLASFDTWTEQPSGWVLGHLAPALADHLALALRTAPGAASATASEVLRRAGRLLPSKVEEAARVLLEGRTAGVGSRKANRSLADLLRVLDFGMLGHPVLAAALARELYGLADVSTALVAGAGMTAETAAEVAASLDAPITTATSTSDRLELWLLPSELLTPDDVEALGLLGLLDGPLMRRARDIDALDEHTNEG